MKQFSVNVFRASVWCVASVWCAVLLSACGGGNGSSSMIGSDTGGGAVHFLNSPGSTTFADFFQVEQVCPTMTFCDFSTLGTLSALWEPVQNSFSVTHSSEEGLALVSMTINADSLLVDIPLIPSPFSSGTDLVKATSFTGAAGEYREYVISQNRDKGRVAKMVAYSFPFDNGDETDYLAFGSWFANDERTFDRFGDEVMGVFSGSSTDGADMTMPTDITAVYRGDAVGHVFVGGVVPPNRFHGTVTLTATFDRTPTVVGTIHDINYARREDEGVDVFLEQIWLQSTEISEAPGTVGQFSGETAALRGGRHLPGRWAGQFSGTQAQAVHGTFSVQIQPLIGIGYTGSFGAKKRPDPMQ